jgi:CRISPR-associated protein Cas4
LFDQESKTLIERKNKIKRIYDGYYLQLYAQYYCLIEMGFEVNNLKFYSISDNKSYPVKIPEINEKNYLKHIIHKMRTFDLTNKDFKQNRNKCEKCIYRELCDYYDE